MSAQNKAAMKLMDPSNIEIHFGVDHTIPLTSVFPNLASIVEYWKLQARIENRDPEAVMKELHGPFLEHSETLQGEAGFFPWKARDDKVPFMDHYVAQTVRRFGYDGLIQAALQVPNLPREGSKFLARAFPDRWPAFKLSPEVVRLRNAVLHMPQPEHVTQQVWKANGVHPTQQPLGDFIGHGAVVPMNYVNIFTGERIEADQFAALYTAGAFLGIDDMILLEKQLAEYDLRKRKGTGEITQEELDRFKMVWSQHIFAGTPESFARMHEAWSGTQIHFERKEDGVYLGGEKVGEYVHPADVRRTAATVSQLLGETAWQKEETRQVSLERRLQPRVGLEYTPIQGTPEEPEQWAVRFNEPIVVDGVTLVGEGHILGAAQDIAYYDFQEVPTAKTIPEMWRGWRTSRRVKKGIGDIALATEDARAKEAVQLQIAVEQRSRAEALSRQLTVYIRSLEHEIGGGGGRDMLRRFQSVKKGIAAGGKYIDTGEGEKEAVLDALFMADCQTAVLEDKFQYYQEVVAAFNVLAEGEFHDKAMEVNLTNTVMGYASKKNEMVSLKAQADAGGTDPGYIRGLPKYEGPEENLFVLGDARGIRIVLDNLFRNSHGSKGNAETIIFSVGQENYQGTTYNVVTLQEEKGKGMDEATRRGFEQGNLELGEASDRKLGHRIVHDYMELHGGFVKVESELEVGTTTKLYFPIMKTM